MRKSEKMSGKGKRMHDSQLFTRERSKKKCGLGDGAREEGKGNEGLSSSSLLAENTSKSKG